MGTVRAGYPDEGAKADGMGESEAGNPHDRGAGWMVAPLNTLPRWVQWVSVLVFTVLGARWSWWLNGKMSPPFDLPDVKYYEDVANGQMRLVPQPFSSRPLAPLLVRWFAHVTHWTVRTTFVQLAVLSLMATLAMVLWLAMRTKAPRWVVAALVFVPFWPQLLHSLGFPDPLYAALLGCLLVALAMDRVYLAAVLMLPLMLARESTSLTLVCFVLACWQRMRWRGSAVAVLCALGGSLVVSRMSAGSLPNPEHLPNTLYMLGKVPWNFLRMLGVMPWSNLYTGFCNVPQWRVQMHLGPLQGVGVCGWSGLPPLEVLATLLTIFGILPAVTAMLPCRWRECRGDLLLRFCLLYGGISFVLAPVLGTAYSRLYGYGWPLLLVAAPRFLARAPGWRDGSGRNVAASMGLLAAHLGLCAAGAVFVTSRMLLLSILLYVFGIALIVWHRRGWVKAVAGV